MRAIDEGGEASVRVNEIVAEAGVTLPTLYRHFGSRDGLIEVAQTQRFKETQFIDSSVFAAALARCKTKEDFRKAVRKELIIHFDKDRWELRRVRINAFGAAYRRPGLVMSLAAAQRNEAMAVVSLLEPYQKKGWIRKEVNLPALVYWYMGQMLGRSLIEMGDSPVSEKKWNETMVDAVLAITLGDPVK